MLSFGFIDQSLAQNVTDAQSHANKIKISADNPPVPSYLKHSKKAKQQAELQKQQKKDSPLSIIGKMLKALFLAIALFLGLVAVFVKNKDKFNFNFKIDSQSPISLAQAIKQEEPIKPEIQPQDEIKIDTPIKPEIISADKQIRTLVFNFFQLNK